MRPLAKFLAFVCIVAILYSIDRRLATIESYLKIQTLMMLEAAGAQVVEPAPAPRNSSREARG